MRIIVDAMGGDNAPEEIVKGAVRAKRELGVDVTLVGIEDKVRACLKAEGCADGEIEVVNASEVVTMEDDPSTATRRKKDSSMAVALTMLKDGKGDAVVSAGSTGALHVGSSLIIRPCRGVMRSGIATILPFAKPMMLLDSGANVTVTADYLEQWAIMGSIYMKSVLHVAEPTVGLLNNGTEPCKGTQMHVDAYERLSKNPAIRFVGNVESRELPNAPCDVLVTDGFTGNIVLKLTEGMAKFFFGALKDVYTKNTVTKMSFLMIKDSLRGMKSSFDASAYGGAPLLGLRKPVIKAHGSSDARAITNAIRQAEAFVQTGVIAEMEAQMETYAGTRKTRVGTDTAEKAAPAENTAGAEPLRE